MSMTLKRTSLDDYAVLDIEGEIDVSTADELRSALGGLIEAGDTRILVDLQDVQFMDSTGLGVLVSSLKRARGEGGDLRLVVKSERLTTLLRITALEQVFTIGQTPQDAVAG